MESLDGKIAVVVGAATGIGAGIAQVLAQRGARVELGDVDLAGAQALARDITLAGGQSQASRIDVTQADGLAAFAQGVRERAGRVDYLFANAGAIVLKPFVETTAADWSWLFGINLFGCVNTVSAFLPGMIAQGGPSRVIVTASINVLRTPAMAGQTIYMATKAAQAAFCRGLENDLRDTEVAVSTIYPGSVATQIKEKSAQSRPEAIRIAVPAGAHGAATLTPLQAGERIVDQVALGFRHIFTHPGERGPIAEAQAQVIEQLDAAARLEAL